jgi:hypothetical protein
MVSSKPRVLAYVRTSTRKQDGEGQRLGARQFCTRNDLELVETFQDLAWSGATYAEARPGFADLVTAVWNGLGDYVWVGDSARMTRLPGEDNIRVLKLLSPVPVIWDCEGSCYVYFDGDLKTWFPPVVDPEFHQRGAATRELIQRVRALVFANDNGSRL